MVRKVYPASWESQVGTPGQGGGGRSRLSPCCWLGGMMLGEGRRKSDEGGGGDLKVTCHLVT